MNHKIIIKIILLGCLQISAAMAAEIRTLSNPYFKTQIYSTYESGISISNPSLDSECDRMVRHLNNSQELSPEVRRKRFLQQRNQVNAEQNPMDSTFSVRFKLQNQGFDNLLANVDVNELNLSTTALKEQSKLPLDVLLAHSVQVVDFESSKVQISNIDEQSLSNWYKREGLPFASIRLEKEGSEYFLNVMGRDLACDLNAGQVQLLISSPVLVRPSPKDQEDLGQFYFELRERISPIIESTTTLRKKAARIGYHTSEVLERYGFIQTEIQEKYVGNLMDFLFTDDELKLSKTWNSKFDNKTYISAEKMIKETVNIIYKRK